MLAVDSMQKFNPKNHITNLIDDPYYQSLVTLRSLVSSSTDSYFQALGAPRVDLYMVTSSVSSPMGKGSDSKPWLIKMGERQTNLVDSAQFGMEPLVQKNIDMVYCYLPSFRGENADASHLSQFYHCETEMKGDLTKCLGIAEGLIANIAPVLESDEASKIIAGDRLAALKGILKRPVEKISFDHAVEIFEDAKGYIENKPHGRRITRGGEIELSKRLFDHKSIFWITGYDRDVVPFYQKPDPNNADRVMNGDLIVPLIDGVGFAGEVLGAGQRQESVDEMRVSMRRQAVQDQDEYDWYIAMRQRSDYAPTSGFGLGVERLISWLIGTSDIASAALYPVMNNVKTEY